VAHANGAGPAACLFAVNIAEHQGVYGTTLPIISLCL